MTGEQTSVAPEVTAGGPLGVPQHPNAAQGPRGRERAAGARTAAPATPEQLTLPDALIAAVCLPVPIPSARRRGRRVHHLPDIANYQPEENR